MRFITAEGQLPFGNCPSVLFATGFIGTPGNQHWFNSFAEPKQERQRTIDLHPVKKLGTTYLIDGGRSALMQDT